MYLVVQCSALMLFLPFMEKDAMTITGNKEILRQTTTAKTNKKIINLMK